jgi:xanthine dehydrogenase molybdopterin-binding subunit B
VAGRALDVDDLKVSGMLHGRTVRSTAARGIIRRIELGPAFDWNGVVIAGHQDIPGQGRGVPFCESPDAPFAVFPPDPSSLSRLCR